MKSVARRPRRWKKKVSERGETAKAMAAMDGVNDTDVRVEFIQALIPIGLKAVEGMLEEEAEKLAGPKKKHGKANTRRGSQDGSKGIIKAINQRFRGYAVIQRCQWHKRENAAGYLSKPQQAIWRGKLRTAYAKTTCVADGTAQKLFLSRIQEELKRQQQGQSEGVNEQESVQAGA